MKTEEQILKEIKELGEEVRQALGKLPPPSRHNSTVGAWRRISEVTDMIDQYRKDTRPGGKMFGNSIRSDQVMFILNEIRDKLVGKK